MRSSTTNVSSLGGGLRRVVFWSAAAVFATGLSVGCGGGDENPEIYDVTVSVTSQTDLNSVHFHLGSYFHDGDWIGHGDDLECDVLVDADLESDKFGGDPGRGPLLELRLSNDNGFPVPDAVIRCSFKTSEEFRGITECSDEFFQVGYFCVELLDATNTGGSPTNATVEITSVVEQD